MQPSDPARPSPNPLEQPEDSAAKTLPPPSTRAFAIREVVARELQQVRRLCGLRHVNDRLNPVHPHEQRFSASPSSPEQFGVCFSGGGIRSASVNMGIIQALAKSGFLRQVHYLSGVSGGGYILGWLTTWIARAGFDAVESQLQADSAWPKNMLPERPAFRRFLEPNPIHYLRRYVSYLAPRAGFGSGDTLAAAAIYLRNVLLMQATACLALMGLMALVQMAAPDMLWYSLGQTSLKYRLGIVGAALLFPLAIFVWMALDQLARNAEPELRRRWATLARIAGFAMCGVLWLYLPWWASTPQSIDSWTSWLPELCIFAFFVAEPIITAIQNRRTHSEELLLSVAPANAWWARLLAAAGASGLAALLLHLFRLWLTGGTTLVYDLWAVLGLPAVLLAGCLLSFLQIGLYGGSMPDAKREWLGRMAGYLLFFAVIAAVTLYIALLGPVTLQWIFSAQHAGWKTTIAKWVLPGGWIATTVAGLIAARSPKTGDDSHSRVMEWLAAIAPPAFLFGLMVIVSWGTFHLARRFDAGAYLTTGITRHAGPSAATRMHFVATAVSWQQGPHDHPWRALGGVALCGIAMAWLLASRIKANEFSLHLFYRNRLVRTFLGASNISPKKQTSNRKPDPFTGFALDDDHYLGSLRQGKFDGPYPIWCAALNLTTEEDLAWQKRKAASFIYSPLFCGWDYVPHHDSVTKSNAYREVAACTQEGESNGVGYGGLHGAPLIGTAMAASGAAVSPNWGYHTKPAVAALLALFNVRVGWWAGNPLIQNSYTSYTPGAAYLLWELLGAANEERDYVYLSDGGHFENLGLYELVRRRVKYIIACDADADPAYGFGDLSNAIEKCRVDFGVQIEMANYFGIAPSPKPDFSKAHCAVGLIHYRPQTQLEVENGTSTGVLLYIKSSLTGDEPAQVLGQHSPTSQFPHDTTLNQFFDETKFETYRALGQHMAEHVLGQYNAYRKTHGADPVPDAMTRQQRAELVREFFETFLRDAFTNGSLIAG